MKPVWTTYLVLKDKTKQSNKTEIENQRQSIDEETYLVNNFGG